MLEPKFFNDFSRTHGRTGQEGRAAVDGAMNRPGQPAELATAYVMLADPLSSYTSGATIAVTGGRPLL